MSTRAEYLVQVQRVAKIPGSTVGAYVFQGGQLTYSYDSPLRVGDRVMCPGNEFSGPFIAVVRQVGSDYQGYVRSLLCRVAPDRKRP